MTPLFPELSDDLAAAAERAVPPRRRRLLAIIGGGLVVVAVAGGATAATGVWRPQIGDERRGHPTISATQAPPAQLRVLGVLRRPAADADRGPDVRRILRLVGRGLRGVRTDAVRLLDPAGDGASARVLVPAERAHGDDDALCLYVADGDGAGSTCFTLGTVLRGRAVLATGNPAPLTARERRANARAEARAERRVRTKRRALRARLAPLPKDPAARRRRLLDAYAAAGLNGVLVRMRTPRFTEVNYFGLVPDGVATVTRTASDATTTVAVHDNAFRIRVPRGTMARDTFTWRDADGRIVRPAPGD
jgi:hypothetical protein